MKGFFGVVLLRLYKWSDLNLWTNHDAEAKVLIFTSCVATYQVSFLMRNKEGGGGIYSSIFGQMGIQALMGIDGHGLQNSLNLSDDENKHHRVRRPLRPEGGVKVDFPVFTYLIRAAGDEQEEKNRT